MGSRNSRSKVNRLAEKHRLPPALISWRLMMGFPTPCLGATDLEDGQYFQRNYEQQPYLDKKTLKNTQDPYEVTPYSPHLHTTPSHIKVSYKRKSTKKI